MSLGDEVVGRVFAQGKAWSPKEEASLILGKCQVYSQELRGVQTFKVQAYYGSPQASAFHYISTNGRIAAGLGETEEPNPRGMAAQGMRMGDIVVNRAFAMFDRLWQVNEHLLTQYERERDHYQTEFRAAEGIIHTMIREKIQESHAQKMRELEFERGTVERQKILSFLPAMLRHLTGDKNIVPEDLANTSILESAALAIRKMPKDKAEEVMTKLAGVSPELVMVLGSRLGEITKRQEEEEEAVRLLAKARTEDEKERDRELATEILNGKGTVPALNS